MSSAVKVDTSRQLVLVVFAGALDADLVDHCAVAATAAALEHGLGRYLVDMRGIANPLSARELVLLGRGLGELGFELGQRVAIVALGYPQEDRLLEGAAAEAGYSLRVFPEESLALSWLGEPLARPDSSG